MVKVTGPLFSIDARGTLGRVLSYQRGFGKHRVTVKPDHPDAETASQLGQRQKFQQAIAYWKGLSVEEKAAYNALADPMRMTGYQYVLKLHMLGWQAVECDDQVDVGTDDGHEDEITGEMYNSLTFVMANSSSSTGLRDWGAVRFHKGPFPPHGAVVTAAYVEVEVFNTAYGYVNCDIYAQDVASPGTLTETPFDISSRDRTAASAPWVQDDLGKGWKQSPSLVSVVQELVNKYTPAAIVLIFKPRSDLDKYFAFYSYEQTGNVSGAKLHLEWTQG